MYESAYALHNFMGLSILLAIRILNTIARFLHKKWRDNVQNLIDYTENI